MKTVPERVVLAAWGLEDSPLDLIPEGSVNRVYRVQRAGQALYLRAYRTTDPDVLRRERTVIAAATAAGVPAPFPCRTLTRDVFVQHEGALYALFPQARGVQTGAAALTDEQAAAAGRTLAHLHLTLQSLPDEGWRRYRFEYDPADWDARLARLQEIVQQFGPANPTHRWALDRLAAQRRWLRDPAYAHRGHSAGAMQVIHGDFHAGNLFFEGADVSAVIDWEQAAWMPRAYELVRSAAYMFNLELHRTTAFLQSYMSRSADLGCPMDRAELALYGVQADHHVWALEEVYLHGNPRASRFIPHRPFQPFSAAWNALHCGTLSA